VTGYAVVLRDTTQEQKKMLLAEQALEMTDRAVLVCDDTLRTLVFNAKLKEITGARDADLVTAGTFLVYLRENRICKNFAQVSELVEKPRPDRKEVLVKVEFSDGASYFLSVRSMYAGDACIGRTAVFIPSG
jgi:hypothetical protein